MREDITRHVLPFIFNDVHVSEIKRTRDINVMLTSLIISVIPFVLLRWAYLPYFQIIAINCAYFLINHNVGIAKIF